MSRADNDKPRGRDEVVDALLHAAAALFAAKGPAQVSLRDVAQAANVNVGLIHRHIGSKDDLVAAVLRDRPGFGDLERLATTSTPIDLVLDVLAGRARLGGITEVHARLILDGYTIRDFQTEFPVIDWLIEHLGERLPDDEARLRVMALTALIAGWRLLGAEYLAVAGLGDLDAEEVARRLAPAVEGFLDAPAAPEAAKRRRAR